MRFVAGKEAAVQIMKVETAVPPFVPAPISDAEAAAMFRAAVNLFRLWDVTDDQAATMLDLPPRTYARWKAGTLGRIGRDGKARLSNLMGIHKALRLIFRDPARGYGWIKAANEAFGVEADRLFLIGVTVVAPSVAGLHADIDARPVERRVDDHYLLWNICTRGVAAQAEDQQRRKKQ